MDSNRRRQPDRASVGGSLDSVFQTGAGHGGHADHSGHTDYDPEQEITAEVLELVFLCLYAQIQIDTIIRLPCTTF